MGPDELDPTDLPLLLVEDIVDTEGDADVAVAGVWLLPALPLVVTRLLLLFLLPVSLLLPLPFLPFLSFPSLLFFCSLSRFSLFSFFLSLVIMSRMAASRQRRS